MSETTATATTTTTIVMNTTMHPANATLLPAEKSVIAGVVVAWAFLGVIIILFFVVYCSRYKREKARAERLRRTPFEAEEERNDFLLRAHKH